MNNFIDNKTFNAQYIKILEKELPTMWQSMKDSFNVDNFIESFRIHGFNEHTIATCGVLEKMINNNSLQKFYNVRLKISVQINDLDNGIFHCEDCLTKPETQARDKDRD